jgi:hypothetical protein
MYDMLPFPHIEASSIEEQSAQINNYLVQFKETLEFILMNISVDNLSADLVDKINSLGKDIEKGYVEREEEIQQVTGKMLTVSDVLNSSAYKADIEAREAEIQKNLVSSQEFKDSVAENVPTASEILESLKLTVNYETGHLEY